MSEAKPPIKFQGFEIPRNITFGEVRAFEEAGLQKGDLGNAAFLVANALTFRLKQPHTMADIDALPLSAELMRELGEAVTAIMEDLAPFLDSKKETTPGRRKRLTGTQPS